MANLKFSDTEVDETYTEAYLIEIPWRDVLPANMFNRACAYAERNNTKVDIVAGLLVAGISGILNQKSVVRMKKNHSVPLNEFIAIIGITGSGKSHAYKALVKTPVKKLQQEKEVSIMINDFTRSGLTQFLTKNKNRAFWAGDEFCTTMSKTLSDRSEDFLGFRGMLNKFFCWDSHSKFFLSSERTALETSESVHLSILALTQPEPWLRFLAKLVDVPDGLCDRFLTISARVTTSEEQVSSNATTQDGNIADESFECDVQLMYTQIFDAHKRGFEFTLHEAALRLVEEKRTLSRESVENKFLLIEERLRNRNSASTLSAAESSESSPELLSKTIDHGIRLSALLKCIDFAWLRNDQTKPPSVLEKEDVEKGFLLAQKLNDQLTVYVSRVRDAKLKAEKSGCSSAKKAKVVSASNLAKLILLMPGRFVTTRQVIRKYRIYSAEQVKQKMEEMSCADTDSMRYAGQFMSVAASAHSNKKTFVFFKANPMLMSDIVLHELSIEKEEYSLAWAAVPENDNSYAAFAEKILQSEPPEHGELWQVQLVL